MWGFSIISEFICKLIFLKFMFIKTKLCTKIRKIGGNKGFLKQKGTHCPKQKLQKMLKELSKKKEYDR